MEEDDPEFAKLRTIIRWLDMLQPNAQKVRGVALSILSQVTGSVTVLSEGTGSIRVPVLVRVCKTWRAALQGPTKLREVPRRTEPFDSSVSRDSRHAGKALWRDVVAQEDHIKGLMGQLKFSYERVSRYLEPHYNAG